MAAPRLPRLADGARVGVMPVRRHLLWRMADHRACPCEEAFGRLPVARLAQHRVDQIAVGVNGPIGGAPAPVYLHVGLVAVPLYARFAPSLGPSLIREQGSEARLPLSHGLVGEGEAPREEHLGVRSRKLNL